MRWDALWYQRIVTQGYSATDGTAQFHPLYPWMANPLARIGISPTLSLLIITSLAGIALFYCFIKLAQFDLTPKDSFFALILFALAPPAFILFAPYAEALFLLAAVLCMIFIRKKLWWLAGLMGGLAALTRQQGIFLLIPMAWELWEGADRKLSKLIRMWRDWFALGLIPVGMLVWLVYRAISLNDMHVNIAHFQEFVYSIAISPSATQVVPNQQFIWPWLALKNSLVKLFTQPDIDLWVNIIIAVIFLLLLAISWRKLRLSYRLYSLGITWISFSYYTGSVHPYMGLPRHLLLAFPVFIGLAVVIKNKWTRLVFLGLSAVVMTFLLVLYVLNSWVP
jgi:Gpi18-like mannosyltransferase